MCGWCGSQSTNLVEEKQFLAYFSLLTIFQLEHLPLWPFTSWNDQVSGKCTPFLGLEDLRGPGCHVVTARRPAAAP